MICCIVVVFVDVCIGLTWECNVLALVGADRFYENGTMSRRFCYQRDSSTADFVPTDMDVISHSDFHIYFKHCCHTHMDTRVVRKRLDGKSLGKPQIERRDETKN